MTNKACISLVIALMALVVSIAGYTLDYFNKPELFAYDVQARKR